MKREKSFTVIELLLVIAIIGLLATIIFVALNSVRAKGRDSRRLSEIDSLRKALEFYYIDYGQYPEKTSWIKIEEDTDFLSAISPYISEDIQDPLYESGGEYSYQYTSEDTNGTEYKVCATMETYEDSYCVYSLGGGSIAFNGGANGGGGEAGGDTFLITSGYVGAWSPSNRRLVRESSGRIWTAYEKQVSSIFQVFVAYSDDNGETWEEEQVTSGSNNIRKPSLAIDSNNELHLLWANIDLKIIYYQKRTDSWQASEFLSTYMQPYQGENAIAIDSNDDVHAVLTTGYGTISYKKRTSSGWEATEEVSATGGVEEYPSVAIDSNNDVHVVFNDRLYGVKHRERTSSGWQTLETVDSTGIAQAQVGPCVALDSNDYVHVVWGSRGWGDYTSQYQIVYSQRITSWQDVELVTNVDAMQTGPSVALDASDNIYVVWSGKGWGTNTGNYNIQLRKKSGSWEDTVSITDRNTDRLYPSLIWSEYPNISGTDTNIAQQGAAFIWGGWYNNNIEFHRTNNLTW